MNGKFAQQPPCSFNQIIQTGIGAPEYNSSLASLTNWIEDIFTTYFWREVKDTHDRYLLQIFLSLLIVK